MLLVYAAIILTMLTVMVGMFIRHTGQYSEMLYQETTDSLFLISNDIKLYLNAIETDSYYMVADSSLQASLSDYIRTEGRWSRTQLRDKIESIVYSYAGGNRFTQSVTLITPDFTVCRGSTSLQETDTFLQKLKGRADEERGREFWVASEADPSTILMVRSYREIKNLSLKTMGYLIFRVDMELLVKSLMENYAYLTVDVPLVITDRESGDILYPAGTTDEAFLSVIGRMPANGYQIIKLGENRMFAVAHTVREPKWNYFLLIPYNAIFRSMTESVVIMVIILCSVTLVMLLAANLFSSGLCRHFNVLQMKMQRVRSGNLEPISTDYDYSMRKDEIGYLHQSFDVMLRDFKQLTDDNYTKQLLLKEAQIKSLEQQINPHFLYNTLDLIYWRAKMNDQEEICSVTEALAKLLQSSLSSHQETSPLEQELELCHYYIRIQQLRFDDRMEYTEKIDNALLQKRVPYMCIQPLLENAVKYGVEQSMDACSIELAVYADENLRIAVQNSGSEAPQNLMELLYSGEKKPQGHGIGLINIDTRTKLLFGQRYGLSFESKEEWVRAILTLPLLCQSEKDGKENAC